MAVRQDRQHAFKTEPIFCVFQIARQRVHVGAVGDEELCRFRMVFCHRPHERGLTQAIFASIHGRAAFDEQTHGFRITRPGRGHQHRLAFFDDGLRVRSGLQQHFDHLAVCVTGGERQRRHAVAVDRVCLGSGREQHLRRVEVVRARGPMEGRRSVRFRGIHGRLASGRDENLVNRVSIARLDGVDEREFGAANERRQCEDGRESDSFHSGSGSVRISPDRQRLVRLRRTLPSGKQFDRRVAVAELLQVIAELVRDG